VRHGRFAIYTDGMVEDNYHINSFRQDVSYFHKIAARYGLGLRPNSIGYLEPFLPAEGLCP
jgi:hypothetical protein